MTATQTRPRSTGSKPEQAVSKVARFALVARGCFYLLLAALVINLMVTGAHGRQADTKGALTTVTENPAGLIALVAVAAGFLGFGLARLWGAWRDDGPDLRRRIATACQGVFYVAVVWIPLSYVFGNHEVGSNRSQHRMAGDLLALPAGRLIVAALGVVVIGLCVNQIRRALTQEYADGLRLSGAAPWVKWLVHAAATFGIPARAVVLGPLGVCLVVAAVHSDPSHAKGLDQLLSQLAGEWWGVVLLAVAACGLMVFATFTFLEARYRKVLRAD